MFRRGIGLFNVFMVGALVGLGIGLMKGKPCSTTVAPAVTEVPVRPVPPARNPDLQRHGRMTAKLGAVTLDMDRYSLLNDKGEEWGAMGCLAAQVGMEVGGKWKKDQWWVEVHDATHQFPAYIQLPVQIVQ